MGARAPARTPRGVTLIELLVAVAVLSVLAVGASLVVGRAIPGAGDDAARLAALWQQERARAILARQWRGLRLTPGGMTPVVRTETGWQDAGTPRPWNRRPAIRTDAPDPALDGAAPDRPGVVFRPDGQGSTLSISWPGGAVCEAARTGELQCR